LFVYLLYDHHRIHLASQYGCHLNQVHVTFVDDSDDCPSQVKTIKQGQIFPISSSVINELPSSFKSIYKAFRSILLVNKRWPDCDDVESIPD
jgi:predicted NodU family carbamoyl transferase